MSSIYEAKEEIHQIEAQLYPNHLAGGKYLPGQMRTAASQAEDPLLVSGRGLLLVSGRYSGGA